MAAWSLWVFAPTRSWTLSEDFAAGGGAARMMRQFRSRVFNIPTCMSAPTSCLITRSCTPYHGSPGKCVCWFFFGFFLTIVLLEANESGVRSYPEGYLSFVVLCHATKQCSASGRSIGISRANQTRIFVILFWKSWLLRTLSYGVIEKWKDNRCFWE